MSNIQTVKDVYAAYAAGDLEAVLARLSEDVDWENSGGVTDVPWLTRQTGHAGATRFFEAVGLLQVNYFHPKAFFESENVVVVLVDEDVTVKSTGRKIQECDQVHLWTFDGRGTIVRHRQRVDTHLNWTAFHGHGPKNGDAG
jgi:uncharacterized protein